MPQGPRAARSTPDVGRAEESLERLFRLAASRRMQPRQTAAVGADVTRAGYAVLRVLHDDGPTSLGQIAKACSMDPAAAGRQVHNLERDDLVERQASEHDARVAIVRLTPHGRAVYRRIVAFRTDYLRDVLDGWSRADRSELIRLVDRLVDDLTHVPITSTRRPRR